MKKILILLLAFAMTISFAACGSSKSPANDGSEGKNETTAVGTKAEDEAAEEVRQDDTYDMGSSSYSLGGTVTRLGDYTYFTQIGNDNDCSENGTADSEGIYRIGDEENATPELIYSVPAYIYDNIPQMTIFRLAGAGNRIWFIRAENDHEKGYSLNWISPDGTDSGTILPKFERINKVIYDNGKYYISYDGTWTDTYVYDINSEKGEELGPLFRQEGQAIRLLTISHGYVYYITGAVNMDVGAVNYNNGIYRSKLDSADSEEVGAVDGELLREIAEYSYCYASEKYFYYLNDDEDALYAISIEDGSQIKVLDSEDGVGETYFPTWCITEEGIWFVSESGLNFCEPDGSNKKQIANDVAQEYKCGVSVSGNWVFYSMAESEPAYARIAKDGRIFPSTTIVPESWRTELETRENDQWIYAVYPSFVAIKGYKGSETTVYVPEEIDGLPVLSIGDADTIWVGRTFENIKTLIMPKSLKTVSYIGVEGLERVELQDENMFFLNRDFYHSFQAYGTLTLVYPGTLEEWKALCEHNSELYGSSAIMWNEDATEFIISCSDGDYIYDHENDEYHN